MKIQPITNNVLQYQTKKNKITTPNFNGKYYGDIYYDDEEIEICKKYLEDDDWKYHMEDELFKKYVLNDKKNGMSTEERCVLYIPVLGIPIAAGLGYSKYRKSKNKARRLAMLRPHLLNEKIQSNYDEERDILEKTKDENILSEAKNELKNKFISKLSTNAPLIPTAIMLYGGKAQNRDKVLEWIKQQAGPLCILSQEDFGEDIDRTIYYLETQADYATTRYKKSGLRTLVVLNNFDKVLKNDSPALKELLSGLKENDIPLTIIFQTQDPKEFASPYIGNTSRIPVKLKIDESLIEKARLKEECRLNKLFKEYYGGYKYRNKVELYLGDLGSNKEVLYANTHDGKVLKEITDAIEDIKKLEEFKGIKVVQAPVTQHFINIGKNVIKTGKTTADGYPIFQVEL